MSDTSSGAGSFPFRGGRTWYRVAGEGAPPLVVLHGGPGGGHDYLLPLLDLFGNDRTLVFYDQTGCGNSTPRPEWPDSAFTVELFLEELEALVAHLGLRRFHLFGHSWGGMLAVEYALRNPGLLASLTLCSAPASVKLMMSSLIARHAALQAEGVPPEQFEDAFCARHICRVTPLPEGLRHSLALLADNPQVNRAMGGSDENGEVTGTLRGWTCEDRLPGISVPTLVMYGEFDELDDSCHRPFLERIPDVRGHMFAGASHSAYSESPAEFHAVLGSFLSSADGVSSSPG